MPRQGLDAARVVDAAARIADADGLDAVTVARVAAELSVRGPSVYHHVDGRDGLLRGVALRGVRELGAALRDATVGRAGRDAVAALATAYRTYALAHPGCYAATVRAPSLADAELAAAGAETVAVVTAVLRPWGLEGAESIHAVRAIRSALHGFAALEAGGGFGIATVGVDGSFTWLVDRLSDALDART